MNKGLEFIEAMRLYRLPPEKISIVVHRESIVHSLVEYCDNAILAQLGVPDMRLPIQYAPHLARPDGGGGKAPGPADLSAPYLPRPGLRLLPLPVPGTGGRPYPRHRHRGPQRGQRGVGIALFLAGKISFGEIAQRVEHALAMVPVVGKPELEDVLAR